MDIIVSARHMELTGSMNTLARESVLKATSCFSKLNKAEVILDVNEKLKVFSADIILNGKGLHVGAKGEGKTFHAAVTEAADRLNVQLRKKNHHVKKQKGLVQVDPEPSISYDDLDEGFSEVPTAI